MGFRNAGDEPQSDNPTHPDLGLRFAGIFERFSAQSFTPATQGRKSCKKDPPDRSNPRNLLRRLVSNNTEQYRRAS
jgi:hypothetical protein